MPAKQSLIGKRLGEILGCIQHHLDHAIDIAVGGCKRTNIHAEPTRNGGANLLLIEAFTFDFAGFEDVFGERLENGFFLEGKSERLHLADQAALLLPDSRKGLGQIFRRSK